MIAALLYGAPAASGKSNAGTIVIAVVGSVIGALLLLLCGLCFCMQRDRRSDLPSIQK